MSFVNSPKPEYAADGKPQEQQSLRSLVGRLALFLLLVFGISINVYAWATGHVAQEMHASSGQITGIVQTSDNLPLAGALVFVTTMPTKMAQTDENGFFTLKNMPTGSQTVVVVHEEIGQEYDVYILAQGKTDMGSLIYEMILE